MSKPMRWRPVVALACALLCALALVPRAARAKDAAPTPAYQSLDELEGARFAYVNGSVYNQLIEGRLDEASEQFYPSFADCLAVLEAGKVDAVVQLSYGSELAVNRRGGSVALLPERVAEVHEAFFFSHGDPLVAQFDDVLARFAADGTIDALRAKWVSASDEGKDLPEQDWDAPNGTLRFATSGVLEPYSYAGEGGEPLGYDVELALLIARELGYRLEVSMIPMDSIFASVASDKVDFGGSLTNTPERAEVVDFTDEVMPESVAVVVMASGGATEGTELEIPTLSELDGRKVGVVTGTINDQLLEGNVEGSFTFSYFNAVADEIAALKAGKVDAIVLERSVATLAVARNAGVGIIDEPVARSEAGFAFRQGSALVAQFDEVISRMEADGTLDALLERWLGADEAAKVLPDQDWDTPNGTLTMATGSQAEPLSYIKDGSPTGYDLEVALLVCRELGYGLRVESMDFGGLVAAVQSGKADFGGGALAITGEREQLVDFSVPDYHAATVVVVRTAGGGTSAVGSLLDGLSASFRKTFVGEGRWQLILSGLGVTVLICVCAGALGTLLGYATVLARRSGVRWLGRLVGGYQALMGGVPLVVVLMVLYYVVFGSVNVPGVLVAIMAFTLSFGSTSGTTMWTAVKGIDTIQEETGLALGYTRQEVFRKIVFPQARQQFLPQLIGQFVSLSKETSVVGYIAVQDLTRASDLIRSRTMDAFFPLVSTAIIYFALCRLLAWALGRLATRLDATNRPRTIEGVEA